LHIKKIKENRQTIWYNEHTRALKKEARKMDLKMEENKTGGISHFVEGKSYCIQEGLKNS